MPPPTLETCQEKALQHFLHVNRRVCLNMWRPTYTSFILIPCKALSSAAALLACIPSIMIKSLWKNGTKPTWRTEKCFRTERWNSLC